MTDRMFEQQNAYLLALSDTAEQMFCALASELAPVVHIVVVPLGATETPQTLSPDGHKFDVDLAGVREAAEADAAENNDPLGRGDAVTSTDAEELNERTARGSAFRRAIQAALDACGDADVVERTASFAVRKGDWMASVVLQLARRGLNANERFAVEHGGGDLHLIGRAARTFLESASGHLADLGVYSPVYPEYAQQQLRSAATWVLEDLQVGFVGLGLLDSLNVVASIAYERRANKGTLAFAPKPDLAAEGHVLLSDPIPLDDHATVRKLLEASSEERPALFDGQVVHGLANAAQAAAATVQVRFGGKAEWELRSGGTPLFRSAAGLIRLPAHPLDDDEFLAEVHAVFASISPVQDGALCAIKAATLAAGHGALAVFREDAEEECKRIGDRCFRFPPVPATAELVRSLSTMDGALLLDLDGCIHAAGVVLDGATSPQEHRHRGARFNAAVRYTGDADRGSSVALVVSDDGMADVFASGR